MSSKIVIEYSILFSSDYHIGTGLGISGIIDDILYRDSKGRLVIPGSTMKGIIRDACEDIADILGIKHCQGKLIKGKGLCFDKPCILCLIFGSPFTPSHFKFEDARRRDEFYKIMGILNKEIRYQEFLSRVEFHNSINEETGTAKEGFLYSYELGKKSEKFIGYIKEIIPIKNKDEALSLIIAGLRFISHIGGKRRRGKGRCEIKIEKINDGSIKVEDVLNKLKNFVNKE
ncbi:MAG: RAMP superfamily CRISPR-associated protein [Candidatus Omnitrophica bacterium]|nr:RAMP superfamily CRISPR-associated protein [Candidatus Omnitrophota bacterium]